MTLARALVPGRPEHGQGVELRRRVLMTTVVWGDWYLDALLNLSLPSLLASGNLATFCAAHDVAYVIMAPAADLGRIRRSATLHALSRVVAVEFRKFADYAIGDPIECQLRAWADATREARRRGTFILYLPPDVVWSDGSFAELARLLAGGRTIVFTAFLRVVKETFAPSARERLDPSGTVLSLTGQELVTLGLEHLHPLMAASQRNSRYFPAHPEMVVWPVRGEGIVVRVLAREVFIYDPNAVDVDEHMQIVSSWDAGQVGMVEDSDRLFGVSLAPLGMDIRWHRRATRCDEIEVARWWLAYDSAVNDTIAGTALRWHCGPTTQQAWRRVEHASGLWIKRLSLAREGLRVWRSLIDAGYRSAAALLALALRTRALGQALREEAGVAALIFVPSDESLRPLVASDRALHADALSNCIRHHIVLEDFARARLLEERMREGQSIMLKSCAGAVLDITCTARGFAVDGNRILGPARRVGPHALYHIDGILYADPDSPLATAGASG
jgi:hypothetical protein